jgi:hypothetical protein
LKLKADEVLAKDKLISSIPASLGIGSLSELAADFPLVFHLPLHDEKFRRESKRIGGYWTLAAGPRR